MKASQALNRLQMEVYIIHVFYYYVKRSRKPVPGVRIVECGAKEDSEKYTLPHPLVVFFCSHLFALSPRSERLEQPTT